MSTLRLINSQTCQLKKSSTQEIINSKTYQLKNSSAHQRTNSYQLTNSPNHQLINSYQLMNSQTHKLTKSSDQKFTYSSSRKLKFLHFILQIHSNFHSVLAKIQAIKLVKSHPFQPFTPLPLSIFENKSCILHHLAFLDWSLTHNFSTPITCFQHLKTYFLTTFSPYSATCFMVRKGYIYTFTVYVYAFCLALSTILHCIQHHFTLHLAPFYLAFSTKTHCIQHQNALYFAPKRTSFCCKQPQNGCQRRSA